MSNLKNPRMIPFVAIHDPRTGDNRLCSWDGDTERYVVFNVPSEAFQKGMHVVLPEYGRIFRFGEVPPGYDTNQGVTITCFTAHKILEGLDGSVLD